MSDCGSVVPALILLSFTLLGIVVLIAAAMLTSAGFREDDAEVFRKLEEITRAEARALYGVSRETTHPDKEAPTS